MTIEIEELEQLETETTYIVYLDDDSIHTTVTHHPDAVTDWISTVEHIHRYRLNRLIVGLDFEWRPNNRYYTNPIATLQLCVGRRCLIYQLIHTPGIPNSLIDFLSDENYTFVGVGIDSDLEKLDGDYGIGGDANRVDLRYLAAQEYGRRDFGNLGLKSLARIVIGQEIEKPEWITRSRWDYWCLNEDQVMYACVDTFVSFEIGRILKAYAAGC